MENHFRDGLRKRTFRAMEAEQVLSKAHPPKRIRQAEGLTNTPLRGASRTGNAEQVLPQAVRSLPRSSSGAEQVLPKVYTPFRGVSRKGQATIEFILVLLLALAYINAVIIPNADYSTTSVQDVAALGKLKASVDKLSNGFQYVSVSGTGTKDKLEIVVPEGGQIRCESSTGSAISFNTLRFVYSLKSGKGIAACEGDEDINPVVGSDCNRSVNVGTVFGCSYPSGASKLDGPGAYSAAVTKDASGQVAAVFSVVQ